MTQRNRSHRTTLQWFSTILVTITVAAVGLAFVAKDSTPVIQTQRLEIVHHGKVVLALSADDVGGRIVLARSDGSIVLRIDTVGDSIRLRWNDDQDAVETMINAATFDTGSNDQSDLYRGVATSLVELREVVRQLDKRQIEHERSLKQLHRSTGTTVDQNALKRKLDDQQEAQRRQEDRIRRQQDDVDRLERDVLDLRRQIRQLERRLPR